MKKHGIFRAMFTAFLAMCGIGKKTGSMSFKTKPRPAGRNAHLRKHLRRGADRSNDLKHAGGQGRTFARWLRKREARARRRGWQSLYQSKAV